MKVWTGIDNVVQAGYIDELPVQIKRPNRKIKKKQKQASYAPKVWTPREKAKSEKIRKVLPLVIHDIEVNNLSIKKSCKKHDFSLSTYYSIKPVTVDKRYSKENIKEKYDQVNELRDTGMMLKDALKECDMTEGSYQYYRKKNK